MGSNLDLSVVAEADETVDEEEEVKLTPDEGTDGIIYPYGIDRVSDRVGYKVALALEKALAKEKEADARIEELLRKLDEQEEDELLSIDFQSLKNNFKALEDNILPEIKFRLPHVWTKQYASSLMCERDRMNKSPPPDINQPVFTPIDSSMDLTLDEIGVVKRPFLYNSKSLNDISSLVVDGQATDAQTMVKRCESELFHTKPQRVTKRLAGCISSHYDYAGRGLKYYEKCLVYESVSINDDYHYATGQIAKQEQMQSAMDRLDSMCTDLCNEIKTTKLPLIADSQATPSRNHISIGTQIEQPEKSSFEQFVELKRRLAQQQELGKSAESGLKEWSKVTFLKNIAVEEYMKYKKIKKPDEFNISQLVPMKTAKSAKLGKKDKALSINVNYKQKPKKHRGTLAVAPGHSVWDLKATPSDDVEDLWQSVQKETPASPHQHKTPVIQYSSVRILPVIDGYDHITNKMINTSQAKETRIAHSLSSLPHFADMKTLNRSEHSNLKDKCSRNRILLRGIDDDLKPAKPSLRPASSLMCSSSEPDAICDSHSDDNHIAHRKVTFQHDPRALTFNQVIRGAQSVIAKNLAQGPTNSPSHVVDWPLGEKYSKRHFTSPNRPDDRLTPRRYLTELVLGLRKYKLGKAPAVFGYHHAEFGREPKPLKMHQVVPDKYLPGKILTQETSNAHEKK